MRYSALLLPALVAASPIGLDLAPTAAAPDPTQVQITGLTYGGTGCPQGSVGSVISADLTTMTLIFDSYVASIGTGVAVTENRKNCQLNVGLKYPGGFQWSVLSADYRGYAALSSAAVTGVQKSTYYFSGQTAQTSTETDFVGPVSNDYTIHDVANIATVIWSPCGAAGNLNINSQIRLTSTNSSASGLLTTDSTDLKFTQKLYLQWRAC